MKAVYLVEFRGTWVCQGQSRPLMETKLLLSKQAAQRTRFKWCRVADSYTKTITEFKRWRKVIT